MSTVITRPVATLPPPPSLAAWGLLVALSVPWGATYIFYRVLAGEVPSLSIVLGRVGLAVPVLWLLLRLRGERLRFPFGRFLVMGLFNNVIPFTLIAWAEMRLTGVTAAILNATTPIFTLLVLWGFAGEALTTGRVAGVLLGLAGVTVLVGPSADFGGDLPANLACLGAALSYGFAALWARRLGPVAPLQAATGQCLCSTLLLIPLVLVVDQPWTLALPGPRAWAALFGIAVFSTALAYVIFFRIVAIAGSGNVMLVTLLLPVSTLVIGWVFLGEALTWPEAAGMGLIGLGLAAIDGRLLARRAP